MKADGWKNIIEDANQSESQLKLLAQHLAECDIAKQELRDKNSYLGCTHMNTHTYTHIQNIQKSFIKPPQTKESIKRKLLKRKLLLIGK